MLSKLHNTDNEGKSNVFLTCLNCEKLLQITELFIFNNELYLQYMCHCGKMRIVFYQEYYNSLQYSNNMIKYQCSCEKNEFHFLKYYCIDCKKDICKFTQNNHMHHFIVNTELVIPAQCFRHNKTPLSFFCKNCNAWYCKFCNLFLHKSHKHYTIDDYYKEINKLLIKKGNILNFKENVAITEQINQIFQLYVKAFKLTSKYKSIEIANSLKYILECTTIKHRNFCILRNHFTNCIITTSYYNSFLSYRKLLLETENEKYHMVKKILLLSSKQFIILYKFNICTEEFTGIDLFDVDFKKHIKNVQINELLDIIELPNGNYLISTDEQIKILDKITFKVKKSKKVFLVKNMIITQKGKLIAFCRDFLSIIDYNSLSVEELYNLYSIDNEFILITDRNIVIKTRLALFLFNAEKKKIFKKYSVPKNIKKSYSYFCNEIQSVVEIKNKFIIGYYPQLENRTLFIRWNIKNKKVLNHWKVPFRLDRKLFYSQSKNLIFTINDLSNIIFFDYTNGCNIFTISISQNCKYPSLHPLRYNTYVYSTEEHKFTLLSI